MKAIDFLILAEGGQFRPLVTPWQLSRQHVHRGLLRDFILYSGHGFRLPIFLPDQGLFSKCDHSFTLLDSCKQFSVSIGHGDALYDCEVYWAGKVGPILVTLLDADVAGVVLAGKHVGDAVFQ